MTRLDLDSTSIQNPAPECHNSSTGKWKDSNNIQNEHHILLSLSLYISFLNFLFSALMSVEQSWNAAKCW